MRAPPPTSSFAHDSVAKHFALAESLGSTTSSSDIALIASFGEEFRAFRRCEHTRSRHVCAFSLSVRDVLLSQAATFCGILHAGMQMTYPYTVRASASARHASYTASALRGGRSGRVIRAAPVRSGDLQKRKSGSLARAAGRAGPRVLYPLGTHQSSLHPRYPEIYCAVLDDAARARLLELMQPGTLILQSKERANESD